jgi:transposase
MSGRVLKSYSKEYKLSALKLAEELGSVAEAARSLGIGTSNLHGWKKACLNDGVDSFPGKGKLKPEDEKLHQLEQENRKLKTENEFLKKAATYFAAHQK